MACICCFWEARCLFRWVLLWNARDLARWKTSRWFTTRRDVCFNTAIPINRAKPCALIGQREENSREGLCKI